MSGYNVWPENETWGYKLNRPAEKLYHIMIPPLSFVVFHIRGVYKQWHIPFVSTPQLFGPQVDLTHTDHNYTDHSIFNNTEREDIKSDDIGTPFPKHWVNSQGLEVVSPKVVK